MSLIGIFLIAQPALANIGSFVGSVLGWAIMQLVTVLGKILTWIIGLLIKVAQYNDFIASPVISKGWIIVRDVCNMFFIAGLLLIAFCTVLGVEKYSYKRSLGALLIAAVLVNFSKFICAFFIDIAQILMLTFVNAFSKAASGNFLQMLGMDKWLNFSGSQSAPGGAVLTGALFALILVIISLIVISIMMIILVFRIVIIWILVVLSPLVFILNVFPGRMKSYSNMWWEKFTSQLIVGPVMAFFIFLSFSVASQTSIIPQAKDEGGEEGKIDTLNNSISEAASPSNFAKFAVSIAMLIGSLLVAQQLGVAGGKMAGKAVGKMQAYATGQAGILKGIKDKTKARAKQAGTMAMGVGKGLAGGAVAGLAKLGLETGKKMPVAGKGIGWAEKGVKDIKTWKGNIIKKFEKRREKRAKEIADKGDAAAFFDKVFNAFDRNFDKFGKKDRSVGQLAQAQRVKDAQNRMQFKSADELRVLAEFGSATDKMAAAILLTQRGFLKENTPKNRNIIEVAKTTMASNPILRNEFVDHVKKTSDVDLVAAVEYNNFKKEADVQSFKSDLAEGKIDLNKVISEINLDGLDNLVKNSGGKFGEMVIQSLSGKQLEDLRNTVGTERLDKIYKGYSPAGKSEGEKIKYVKATGRVDNLDNVGQFIDRHKEIVKNNIGSDSLKDATIVEHLLAKLTGKEFKAISDKGGKHEKALLLSLGKLMNKYNSEGKGDTAGAVKARNAYFQLSKGKDMVRNVYKGIKQGKSGERDRQAVNDSIKLSIENNDIKMEHLAKIDARELDAPQNKGIKTAIARAMDFRKFSKLYENKAVARVIAREFQALARSSPADSKYNKILQKMQKSEFGDIF
ncbi:hypothetical protein B6D52_01485 [Candidatus Parcubacteria bacterium 4484_255]|nr:MAG: hypothetical protein B6D52_01485 [Candidatus Parcubacteria bacterium 4484_255]